MPAAALLGGLTALAVLAAAVAWVLLTGMRPSYDAYGWLVWGKQTLSGDLNLNGAPSWKPLTYMFTLVYALAGNRQPDLWMVTSTAGALASGVFAARIAYTLVGEYTQRVHARMAGAAFAAVAVLATGGYWHLVLIASSDPMAVALCLAAVDFHLRERHGIAYTMLVLASMARPEAWLFLLLYAAWAWRARPAMRALLVAGAVLVPAAWFIIPGFSSRSWFISGQLALDFPGRIRGNKFIGVWNRVLVQQPLVIQLGWLAVTALALATRDRKLLTLIGACVLWVAVEIAFALHGWPAVQRYLMEPTAVMTTLVGVAVGRAVALEPGVPAVVRWSAPVLAAAVVIAFVPTLRDRVNETRVLISKAGWFALRINNLQAAFAADGGSARILSCGRPVTFLGYQSTLAWEIGTNVDGVGHKPSRDIRRGKPIVFFRPYFSGWEVRPIHTPREDRAECAHLRIST